jgi:hypothetical protein
VSIATWLKEREAHSVFLDITQGSIERQKGLNILDKVPPLSKGILIALLHHEWILHIGRARNAQTKARG